MQTGVSRLLFKGAYYYGARPFVKWAGGKTQLLPQLRPLVPQEFERYIEPFVGGGALFFNLAPPRAIISDSNEELINCYLVVKQNPEALIVSLSKHEINARYYYQIRDVDPQTLDSVERASRFIYLNKCCYNGLYRVNKRGKFNTPFAGNRGITLVDIDNLYRASAILQNAEIYCADYKEVLGRYAQRGDFIYLDPPYLPVGKYSDFKRYTKEFFYERDHEELAQLCDELDRRGCKFLLSNSYHEKILALYSKWNINILQANRFINCRGNKRGKVYEIIARNYD